MIQRPALSVFIVVFLALFAGHNVLAQPARPAPVRPAPAREISGFETGALDRSVDPCTDFYRFACGGWMAENPVPADQSRWGRFDELRDRNLAVLRDILQEFQAADGQRRPVERLIGDYYTACMDEAGVEVRGAGPLQPVLERIESLQRKEDLPALLGSLHKADVDALFEFASFQDFKNADMVIAALDQGGLGLPDRDYYLKDDKRSVELRQKYQQHVANTFVLIGDPPDKARAHASDVVAFETELAEISMDRVSRRNPDNIYNKRTRDQLTQLTASFDWKRYLATVKAPAFDEINLVSFAFVKGLEQHFADKDVPLWKNYLRWRATSGAAPFLSSAFVNENFDFYGRTLSGTRELRPRWKRCVTATDGDLGEALGQLYVERTFGADGKERMLRMVYALEKALRRDIRELPWMTDTTRKKAQQKLAAISNKIGYPDEWRDYGGVQVRRDDLPGNHRRAAAFEFKRVLQRIGKPVDRKEWGMSPPTVNAYYSPLTNSINFPAGILQPPFFDRAADDALNFGAIGAVIGHELSHGFDDQGSRFAADGNLENWWSDGDAAEFKRRTQCLVDQYGGYTAVDDVKLNGRLTLGENVADNGGVRIALMALRDTLGGDTVEPIDGFTPEQRVFLGWAQIWCQNTTPETARLRAQTNTHSPGRYRVNGVVSNMPEFRTAYTCSEAAPMVRENACRVW